MRAGGLVRRGRLAATWTKDRGPTWTFLAGCRSVANRVSRWASRRMVRIERDRYLTGAGTVSSQTNTVAENRRKWDGRDWSDFGEQWTRDAALLRGVDPDAWKASVVALIRREVPAGARVLEVGPGGGRWTEVLRELASHLVLIDVAETCLDLCRERFGTDAIEYHLVGDDGGVAAGDATIDFVWSYDVFVHINPTDIDRYLAEFMRVLTPGGRAIIHHAGRYEDSNRRKDFRAEMSQEWFADLARRNGLVVDTQDTELPHKPGDVLTYLTKPAR